MLRLPAAQIYDQTTQPTTYTSFDSDGYFQIIDESVNLPLEVVLVLNYKLKFLPTSATFFDGSAARTASITVATMQWSEPEDKDLGSYGIFRDYP